jgi:hypothetical protein
LLGKNKERILLISEDFSYFSGGQGFEEGQRISASGSIKNSFDFRRI